MGTILIVEDDGRQTISMKDALDGVNHDVFPVVADKWRVAAEEAAAWLRQHASEQARLDILVLDIRFKDRQLGGIEVYNQLVADGLRPRWRHTLICSRYKDYGGGQLSKAVVEFMDRERIPQENLIPKLVQRDQWLIQRIKELLGG